MTKQNKVSIRKMTPIIALAVLLVLALCLTVQGQGASEKHVITIGIGRWISNPDYDKNIEGFKDGLAENGYVEGHDVKFIVQNPEADKAKQRKIIQSFIDKDVDLIYSLSAPGTLIAKEMTQDKPIVFSFVTYPVESQLIDSLVSSDNNLVGTRNYISVDRQYAQFEKVNNSTARLAFVHGKDEPDSTIQFNEMKKLLDKKGITVVDIAAVSFADIRSQLEIMSNNVDSVYAACDTLIHRGGEAVVIAFSKQYKKPTFTCNENGVLAGELIGNVADPYAVGKVSGRQASLILEGAKPTLLLTESIRDNFVLINIKTAEELEITVPASILDSAREIVDE